jgi:CARDB protein
LVPVDPPNTKADLWVENLWMSPTFPKAGETATIYWDICNAGNQATGPFEIARTYNGDDVGAQAAPSFNGHACMTMSWPVVAQGGDNLAEICLDSTGVVDEGLYGEGNNYSHYGFHVD